MVRLKGKKPIIVTRQELSQYWLVNTSCSRASATQGAISAKTGT